MGFLSLSLFASPASAQADSAAARALFSEGRKLMQAEKFDEACPKFEESLRLDNGIGTQFNLAHCWEKIGRTASAWAMFLDVAAAARASNQNEREAAARERASVLEPKLTRMRIVVTDPAPDTKVTRDEVDVRPAAWGTAMPVDPGEHVVTVTAPGKQSWSQAVKVPANSKTFSVTVPVLEDVVVAKAPEPVAPTEPQPVRGDSTRDSGGGSGSKMAAYVVGGVGLAAVATGTLFALQSRSDNNKALGLCLEHDDVTGEDICPTPDEQTSHDDLVKDAKREQVIGIIGFGVGGAALVTAVILYVTAGDDSDPERADLFVTPVVGPNDWGAALTARF
jgi:hypothetical protein